MSLRLAMLNVALWGGVAAAALTIVDAARAPAPPQGSTPDAAAAPPAAEMRLPPPPSTAYAAIADRPLFTPSRRPPAPEALRVDASPPAIALLGVAGLGEARVATLRTSAGKTLRVAPGALLGDWVVARIEPRRVTLRLGDDEHVALLGEPAPDGAAARSPGGAAPQRPDSASVEGPVFDLTPPEAAYHHED